jgi:hypothetical protein
MNSEVGIRFKDVEKLRLIDKANRRLPKRKRDIFEVAAMLNKALQDIIVAGTDNEINGEWVAKGKVALAVYREYWEED